MYGSPWSRSWPGHEECRESDWCARFNGGAAVATVHPPDRRSAVAAASLTYFTGRACPRGHVALRYTSNAACLECLAVQSYDNRVERVRAEPAPRRCCRCGAEHRSRQCPACLAVWRREHPPSPEQRVELAERQRKRADRCRAFIRAEKAKPCTDCQCCFPWYVMEFDHREGRGSGDAVVAVLVGRGSIERIVAELAKCDLVCSNCHKVRTHFRAVATGQRRDLDEDR